MDMNRKKQLMEDYKNTVKLLTEVLMGLGPEMMNEIKNNPYG